ncbi:DUF72 domain-containing protein [Terrabacter terrae]|uniref:DUF72 domain-containing protein n=1 Tax=Terrabacter terrae TaxID=318434 RepID=UPI0031DE886C
MDVRVGLCGWTVSQASYVRRFPVVEVQHTFYEPPADAVLTRWRTQVPAEFEFTIKAWQIVTHESNSPTYRRLKQPLPDSAHGQVGVFRTTPEVLAGWERHPQDLVHVVDPMQTETVTPERTYYRLHGTSGSRHVHTDDELRRLRDLVDGRPSPYVMFNNLPRVGDAERFLAVLSGEGA